MIFLRPSSSNRWLSCTASIEEEKAYIDKNGKPPDTPVAKIGKDIHSVVDQMLRHRAFNSPESLLNRYLSIEGRLVGLDDKGLNIAESYIKFIKYLISRKKSVFEIEKKLSIYTNAKFIVEGTPDFNQIVRVTDTCYHAIIADLKTGEMLVSPDSNQLILYAIGLMRTHKKIKRVTCIIFQPENVKQPVTKMSFSREQLEFNYLRLSQILNGLLYNPAEFKPRKFTCQWCVAKPTCKAYIRNKLKLYLLPLLNKDPI